MQTIYEPKGRAAEFSQLALNLYSCCNLGCSYCFNKKMPWYKLEECLPREGILSAIEKKAKKMAADKRDILLCVTADPYPVISYQLSITRAALLILEKHKLNAQVLTKAGERSTADFDILKRNGWKFGVTLTCASEEMRMEYEPFTAPHKERVEAMRLAKDMGIPTWVSLEPVLEPDETLGIIESLLIYKYTRPDFWKLGKLNYDSHANKIDWKKYLGNAKRLLDGAGQKYMIKQDLLKAAREV